MGIPHQISNDNVSVNYILSSAVMELNCELFTVNKS